VGISLVEAEPEPFFHLLGAGSEGPELVLFPFGAGDEEPEWSTGSTIGVLRIFSRRWPAWRMEGGGQF